MNDDLPSKMPPRPPPHVKLAGPRPPTTRVPRIFSIWGTLVYGAVSISTFAMLIAMGFGFNPPRYFVMLYLLYVGTITGIVANGRREANKDARFFISALRRRSDENKRRMN